MDYSRLPKYLNTVVPDPEGGYRSNTNVPGRIKQNLLSRKTLVNLFNADDQLEYQPEGNFTVQMEGKTAKVYRLKN
ncbi:MAG: hypothetical protein ACYC4E_01255 [Carboxydocellales bacterium]